MASACLLLVGIALVQDPGYLVPDTKFDLVAAPGEFLSRALHLWDGEAAFGQLQNQAYGYLWPMGPFFLLGSVLDLPGWVVQRLWMALVLCVAFTGTARVTRALGVRSDLACLLAGFAFALSPRMLTTLGPISIEAWPSAMAPWVLFFLVRGSATGSPRRAAALAALAVAMVGGVNAAATFAVLPLGVVWLLTRTPGPRRRSMMLWWPLLTLVGTLWWLVPLFVMGSYSPPFLDYIETTSVTTFPTTLFDVLRGTSNWVPYVDAGSRAGNDLLTTSYLVLNSGVVLLLGIVGLADRRTPHRRFLVLALLVGVLMVAAGHRGAVEGWLAADARGLLDGVLAPLRNVHKFDPILRLPLVVGLAWVVDRVLQGRGQAAEPEPAATQLAEGTDGSGERRSLTLVAAALNRFALVGLAVLVVAGAAVPAALGRITPAGATFGVPDYWEQTAAFLEEESDGRSALVLPGAPFGDYLWGSPKDEPLQYLGQSRWAVRNVIPLTPPGNIRMLDAIEQRLAQGHGSPGLVAFLQRAGVQHLVIRNDLARGGDVPDPTLVHQALSDSPGLLLVARFGPEVGGGATLEDDEGDRVVVNGGWQARYRAIEVFEVPGPVDAAVSTTDPTVVVGGPEDLLDLADLDLVGSAPTLLAADVTDATDVSSPAAGDAPLVLTDGLRARERFFARIHDGDSATLTPGDVPRSGNPARDYRIDTDDRWSTRAVLSGASRLSASSSASDADAFGGARPGQLPYAALDGDTDTQWVSGIGRSEQSWWRVDLEQPVEVGRITLIGGEDADEEQVVRVVTAAGATEPVELASGETRVVAAPPGETAWIRVEDATGVDGRPVALAEVDVQGLDVRRRLALPALPDGWPAPTAIVLRADQDARRGCLEVAGDVRCVERAARQGEEPVSMGRVVTLPEAGSWEATLTALPRGGSALDDLLEADQPLNISASSVAVPDPRGSPLSAVDGDPSTTWISSAVDLRPTLRLSWLGQRRISSVRLVLDEETAAREAVRVTVGWPEGTREVEVSAAGFVSFPAIRTDQLSIRVEEADATTDLGFDAQLRDIGVGVTELSIPGLDYLPLALSPDVRTYDCGTGPELEVDGRSVETAVQASPQQLAAGSAVQAVLCGAAPGVPEQVDLAAGPRVVDVEGNAAFAASSLVLLRETPDLAAAVPLTLRSDSDTRTVEVPAGAAVLALRQNANPGWEAAQDGRALEPIVLDGWQQGWVLDGDAPVVASFAPDRTYRGGMLVGLVLLLGLGVATVVRRRRRDHEVPPSLEERPVPALALAGLAVVGAGLVAGWGGVLVGIAVGGLLVALRRFEAREWLIAVPAVVVGAAYAVRPWGDTSGWAGSDAWTAYAMVVPLVGLLLLVALDERSGTRRLSRRAGRSTRR
ncbi:alpha-(1-_3)-arabinofuranosyltransferase family protein [Nocardioides psychrotolerans]|uniref:alpha-(1->3)-arabinofuranosyltransferase domain-containing protein n=1 Tax=Nocardioides psychrotolerans TaxID=1005945 RepID=UPI003137C7AB